MTSLQWSPLFEDDVDALRALARECLRRDGGLPTLAARPVVVGMYLTDTTLAGRDAAGELVAAAAMVCRPDTCELTALVAPGLRGQGIGQEIAVWAREQAARRTVRVIDESVSPEAEELYAELGLHLERAQLVMRHPLTAIPRAKLPDGITTHPYDEETKSLFHAAYVGSFGDQQGFPDTPHEEWLEWLTGDAAFRPEDSRVALDAAGEAVGFVTLSGNWIEQVGVVPAWRGRGLGAHLVARSLTAMHRSGDGEAWLEVNVANPSRFLYERLGFVVTGRRARYLGL